jgi:hypothetical protein
MTKQLIIERTIRAINQLPDAKAEEISAFVDFVLKRYDEQQLSAGLQQLATNGQTFDFLGEEPELYSDADLTSSLPHSISR